MFLNKTKSILVINLADTEKLGLVCFLFKSNACPANNFVPRAFFLFDIIKAGSPENEVEFQFVGHDRDRDRESSK